MPWQDAGLFVPALKRRGYEVVYVDAMLAAEIDPRADQAEVLIVLGGPNSAYDEHAFPRLKRELQLIETRIESGRPLLGICLGAQLIARVLGAQVRTMPKPEIGFGSLLLTDDGSESVLRARTAAAPVLFWHQDTFELPPGAVHLARSEQCAIQAFSHGANTLALQFHLEPEPSRFEEWLVGNSHQLAQTGIDPVRLRADMQQYAPSFMEAGETFVSEWLDCAEGRREFLKPPGAAIG
jgi:GMP synthase (glutamine-hydrolysing)